MPIILELFFILFLEELSHYADHIFWVIFDLKTGLFCVSYFGEIYGVG